MSHHDEEQPLLVDALSSRNKSSYNIARTKTKGFLESKSGHYAVLTLVSLDVTSIFIEFLFQLLVCEGRVSSKNGELASTILGNVSLIFSCMFLLELLASIWAYGKSFFRSWFRCFDATVILAGFIVDILLRGIVEEAGSLVIVLRLWRVFKIIEELSSGAEEQMAPLQQEVQSLQREIDDLKQELDELKQQT